MYKILLALFVCFVFSITIIAENDSLNESSIDNYLIKSQKSVTTVDSVETFNTIKGDGLSYGKFIFALFVVAGMLFAFYLFLKNKQSKRTIYSKGKNLDVLEEISIGENRLFIVRVSNKLLVMGSGPSGVSLIHTFSDSETIDVMSSYDEGMDGTTSGKFADIVNGFLDKYREK